MTRNLSFFGNKKNLSALGGVGIRSNATSSVGAANKRAGTGGQSSHKSCSSAADTGKPVSRGKQRRQRCRRRLSMMLSPKGTGKTQSSNASADRRPPTKKVPTSRAPTEQDDSVWDYLVDKDRVPEFIIIPSNWEQSQQETTHDNDDVASEVSLDPGLLPMERPLTPIPPLASIFEERAKPLMHGIFLEHEQFHDEEIDWPSDEDESTSRKDRKQGKNKSKPIGTRPFARANEAVSRVLDILPVLVCASSDEQSTSASCSPKFVI